MDFTSTPFDYASADYLYDMVDFYKISSSDLSNLPFVKYIGMKGKPVYISVGAAYLSEVDTAVRILKEAGCKDIVLLHCVLSYPTSPNNANLRVIETLKKVFTDVRVGFSDHVAPDESMMTLATAYLLGAEVIEKHFTLDKSLPGNDHYHSGDPEDFKKAISNFRWIGIVLGSGEKTVLECEQIPRREARRSLVLTRDMKKGEIISENDLMPKRPGTGISPEYSNIVIGRRISRDLEDGYNPYMGYGIEFSSSMNKVTKMGDLIQGKVILISGVAGFIGANLSIELLRSNSPVQIIGIDNMNDYYDVSIKEYRLEKIKSMSESRPDSTWTFIKGSIADRELVNEIFQKYEPSIVVNLAAQAGVRYSITNPDAYIESNLIGFYNILEACRHSYDNGLPGVQHLVYASSSSVYGSNIKVPYSTDDKVDNPVSLYAATKKSNELMAHAYSKLYNIPSTGLRFFTVYGPAGRPDMAYFGFTNKLREGKTIEIFNFGNCKRDFTYVDDIVEGVRRVMEKPPKKETGEDGLPIPPYAVYNIGNSHPENLLEFVDILQQELIRANVLSEEYNFEAHKKLVPMQPGDVPVTYADTSALERDFDFKPSTSLRDGLRQFAEWYHDFYMDQE